MINGHRSIELAGAAQQEQLPVVGPRRCRISRPLAAPATYRARWCSAWRVNLGTMRARAGVIARPDAMVAHWIVEAPWSSEVVHSYSLVLAHLKFQLGAPPPVRYVEGATHELALWAVNPQAERAEMLVAPVNPKRQWLQPPVFAAQMVCASDEGAERSMFRAVELIGEGRLSPHPAHVRAWVELFGDSVLRRARAPM